MVLDGITNHMHSLVEEGKYGAIGTNDSREVGYYVVRFLSPPYTLQANKVVDGKILHKGEQVADACYLESMKSKTLWYFETKGTSQLVTVAMKTTVHPNLSCYIARSTHHIPHTLCDRNEAINAMTRKPILLTQEDHDMIMDEIERRDRIDYEQHIESDEDSSDDE